MLYKIALGLVAALAVAFAGYQFGNAECARDSEARLTQAVSKAVQARNAEVEASGQVQVKKRTTLDSVRPALVKARRQNALEPVGRSDPSDVEFSRLLNDAIEAGNRGIASASDLHGSVPDNAQDGASP